MSSNNLFSLNSLLFFNLLNIISFTVKIEEKEVRKINQKMEICITIQSGVHTYVMCCNFVGNNLCNYNRRDRKVKLK